MKKISLLVLILSFIFYFIMEKGFSVYQEKTNSIFKTILNLNGLLKDQK